MTTNPAVSNVPVKPLTRWIALSAAAALLLTAFGGSASAKPIGKGGSIQACYKVKGKPKGSIRVVPTGKKCKRGERKLVWSMASAAGQPGAAGAQGAAGSQGTSGAGGGSGAGGANGANGADGSAATTTLETKVASLSLKLDSLEGVLDGVTNGDLTGALDTLDGVTNGELVGALGKLEGIGGGELDEVVGGLPVLNTICPQTKAVTEQANKLGTALGGFSLNGILTNLGGVLTPPTAPTPLAIPTCPS